TEFILARISEQPELQLPLFLLFLGIYVFTVVGNLGMITLIGLSPPLHTPMYYLLRSLSFIDLCHSTVITPKMLISFVTEKNAISYLECMTQLYFFLVFVISECHMLAAMAYERYVAICSPLLYSVTMSQHACISLISAVYAIGVVCTSVHIGCLVRVHFCKLNVINHYFCDLPPLLKISCSSTYINELLILCFGTFNICVPTFSTCSSHLSAVAVFFGSAAFMYLQPSSVSSMDQVNVSSVFYTIIVAMLNPLIYSLRNKDFSITLKKMLER
uniref:Olfactory receptor n=1 Tax=Cavia porcellus TaxID=10141 RepID=A0A286Y5Q9_CAVPO